MITSDGFLLPHLFDHFRDVKPISISIREPEIHGVRCRLALRTPGIRSGFVKISCRSQGRQVGEQTRTAPTLHPKHASGGKEIKRTGWGSTDLTPLDWFNSTDGSVQFNPKAVSIARPYEFKTSAWYNASVCQTFNRWNVIRSPSSVAVVGFTTERFWDSESDLMSGFPTVCVLGGNIGPVIRSGYA